MLTALGLGNFKAFGATQRIPLKPLTLIFGPNSAGKSSVIHSLALAHEARRSGNLDAFRTDIGGTSIDLGGFRQYVFRRDPARRVEWMAEIDVAKLRGRLAELLAPVGNTSVAIAFGLPLDDLGAPVTGQVPSLATYEVLGDGKTLLRMSQRRDGRMGLDRLASLHPISRQVMKALVESSTTTTEIRAEDQVALDEAIAELIPQLSVKVGRFLPEGIESTAEPAETGATEAMLFPVGRGSRSQDLAGAVRFYLPRILNELIRGLDHVVGEQIDRLQYLGPLRSYPPRHLAFSEHDDANWHAGGGYAWDVLRRDRAVRGKVNAWLGADWLQTHYEVLVRDLVPMAQLEQPLSTELERLQDDGGLDLEKDYDDDTGQPSGVYPVFKDPEAAARRLVEEIGASSIDRIPELVLVDRRTDTVVSHRDVGIGVSQVLPVLVSCYGLRDQIVAIEQPEIHLHPALQAELGDVFLQSALGGQGNRFILESHSEHLMLRILRRIRETAEKSLPKDAVPVKPPDVAVLYIEPTKEGAQVVEIPVTEDGDFARPWPRGFFAERVKELM
jgi:hypothetical protein